MDISVTDFKQRCLEIVRSVERTGTPVAITRHGKVVARLTSSGTTTMKEGRRPWEVLRDLGGELLAKPGESVLQAEDFEAGR